MMHQALDDSDQTRKYGISLVPTVCPSALAGVTGERGELAVVNRGWAGTVPGSYTYRRSGTAAVNRDGRAIHRKRGGGGSYSQF